MVYAVLGLSSVVTIGIVGFNKLEGLSPLDAFYYTSMIMTGQGPPTALSSNLAKIFASVLAFVSVGLIVSSLVYVFQPTLGVITSALGWSRMKIEYKNHVVICGYNQITKALITLFKESKINFVVIEKDKQIVADLASKSVPIIEGDATEVSILNYAKIESAFTLITVMRHDATSALIALTAKHANPKIKIICRIMHEENIPKLQMAGADKVVSTTMMGAVEMAKSAKEMFSTKEGV